MKLDQLVGCSKQWVHMTCEVFLLRCERMFFFVLFRIFLKIFFSIEFTMFTPRFFKKENAPQHLEDRKELSRAAFPSAGRFPSQVGLLTEDV